MLKGYEAEGFAKAAAVALDVAAETTEGGLSTVSSVDKGDGYDAVYAPTAPWQPYECASLETAIPLFRSTPTVFYKYRWMALWPLHRRLPAVALPWVGCVELTLGEFLVLLFGLAGTVGWAYAEYVCTALGIGWMLHPVGAMVIAGVMLAARNCFFTFLLGLSHERALSWHALVAVAAIVLGVYHGLLEHLINPKFKVTWNPEVSRRFISGWVGWILMTLLVVTSAFPQLRRAWFTVWKYMHVIMATLALGAFCAHQAGGMMGALVVWWIDVGLRWWYMAGHKNPKQVEIEVLPGDMLRISWEAKDNFKYSGGQYIYICIPDVSWCEFHPFSISSTPGSSRAHIHVRVAGDWTGRLNKLALKDMRPGEPKRVRAFLEGPFGAPSIDLHGPRYKAFMLVSGGIGVTPMQSLFNHLLIQKARGRPVRALRFVWVVGGAWAVHERTMVPEVTGSMRRASYLLPAAAMGSAHWTNYLGIATGASASLGSLRVESRINSRHGNSGYSLTGINGINRSGYSVSSSNGNSSNGSASFGHGGVHGNSATSFMYSTAPPGAGGGVGYGVVAAPLNGLLRFTSGGVRRAADAAAATKLAAKLKRANYSEEGPQLSRLRYASALVAASETVVVVAGAGYVDKVTLVASKLPAVLLPSEEEQSEEPGSSPEEEEEGKRKAVQQQEGKGEQKEQEAEEASKEGREQAESEAEAAAEDEAETIEDFLSTEFFLNAAKANAGEYGNTEKPGEFNGVPGLTPGMTTGRPDMAALLLDTAVRARRVGELRVAVCVCGPGAMVEDLKRIARRLSGTEEAGGVVFDVQSEVYEI